jgi:hypothetical protein
MTSEERDHLLHGMGDSLVAIMRLMRRMVEGFGPQTNVMKDLDICQVSLDENLRRIFKRNFDIEQGKRAEEELKEKEGEEK